MPLNIITRQIPGWGAAYSPPGPGPFPSILLLHGSEGGWSGWSHWHAAIFAAHGFLAFPFNYSNGGNAWNAGSIIEVPLERTIEALTALREFPLAGRKIGIFGVSRGAEHGLLLASLMARDGYEAVPDALAAHAPPDVICGGFDGRVWRDAGDPGWQPWDPAPRAWSWRGRSGDLLPTTPIEIERYDGALFLSHGTVDQTWSVNMTRRLSDRLQRHGRTPEIHLYEGQDHVLDADAENAHHEHLIHFFKRHLAD